MPTVACWSANARELLGFEPRLHLPLASLPFTASVRFCLDALLAAFATRDAAPRLVETVIDGREFDVVAHLHEGRLLVEFEARELAAGEVAAFAVKAHAGIDALRRQARLDDLLRLAVDRIRALTGFDRVMAYRFRHDDSGDVVAEAVRGDWPRFLGMRYPASDIPAQARRLYVLNTLRMIADVGSPPVPLLGDGAAAQLDLSHAVLRSVSPIHIEYLRNMGVGASMSVSIVVNGRLWGLLACHHGEPKQVPYALRMACDVYAQILAAVVQAIELRERAAQAEQAADVRSALVQALAEADDVTAPILAHAGALAESLGAEALVVAQGGKLSVHGDVPLEVAQAIVASLRDAAEGDVVQRTRRGQWPAAQRGAIGRWVGLLALRFDPAGGGWLAALRPEQVETVRWGGKPEKNVVVGPNGPRLTPRGSFDLWEEIVRDSAEPWDEARLAIAGRLLAELFRASSLRQAELDRMRSHLLAILGHDLRDPLQTISMAARVLELGADGGAVGKRIQASSTRMNRLITHVLDLSRMEKGLGIEVARRATDVPALIRALVEEWKSAHPASRIELQMPDALELEVDPDRFTQVVSNLVSNARHHGDPGHPIDMRLRTVDDGVVLEVRNHGAAIGADVVVDLFRPFKRSHAANPANRGGLGLGLYIAQVIMQAHGGDLGYRHEDPQVVFAAVFPR